eukprot:7378427-Prymnesium_polylepis.1
MAAPASRQVAGQRSESFALSPSECVRVGQPRLVVSPAAKAPTVAIDARRATDARRDCRKRVLQISARHALWDGGTIGETGSRAQIAQCRIISERVREGWATEVGGQAGAKLSHGTNGTRGGVAPVARHGYLQPAGARCAAYARLDCGKGIHEIEAPQGCRLVHRRCQPSITGCLRLVLAPRR